jgi:hypothetical protein
MRDLIDRLEGRMQSASEDEGERTFVLSVEAPVNEYFLQDVQLCDVRMFPPGYGSEFAPLYHFIYHEFMVIQGGFGLAPEPYHLQIRNAYNLVVGEIPGAVMTGDGLLLNRDTANWAPWRPPVGDNDASVEVLRTATALRRGPARDFLVFGRMLRPATVTDAATIQWTYGGRSNDVPAIFHAAWQAPDGRVGVVLANWTSDVQTARVFHERLTGPLASHRSGKGMSLGDLEPKDGAFGVTLPPLSCALFEQARGT